jgi:hypothetical protein
MADLTKVALFGDDATAYRTLGANMLNPVAASGETDWGAILMNGIRGAAQGAIASQVQGAYSSGQLQPLPPVARTNSLMPLLLIGGLLYMVAK